MKTDLAKKLDKEQAQALFDRIDLDKSGGITFQEWIAGIASLEIQLNILNKSDSAVNPSSAMDDQVQGAFVFAQGINRDAVLAKVRQAKNSVMPVSRERIQYKLIDLGTAIAVSDALGDSENTTVSSMMTFTAMDFAGALFCSDVYALEETHYCYLLFPDICE